MVLNFGVFCPVSNSPTWTLCYVMRPSLARKARGRQWGLSRDIWRRLKCEIETYTSSFLPSTVYRPHRWFYHERRESVRWEISACACVRGKCHAQSCQRIDKTSPVNWATSRSKPTVWRWWINYLVVEGNARPSLGGLLRREAGAIHPLATTENSVETSLGLSDARLNWSPWWSRKHETTSYRSTAHKTLDSRKYTKTQKTSAGKTAVAEKCEDWSWCKKTHQNYTNNAIHLHVYTVVRNVTHDVAHNHSHLPSCIICHTISVLLIKYYLWKCYLIKARTRWMQLYNCNCLVNMHTNFSTQHIHFAAGCTTGCTTGRKV